MDEEDNEDFEKWYNYMVIANRGRGLSPKEALRAAFSHGMFCQSIKGKISKRCPHGILYLEACLPCERK
jgi:hypothetical protein